MTFYWTSEHLVIGRSTFECLLTLLTLLKHYYCQPILKNHSLVTVKLLFYEINFHIKPILYILTYDRGFRTRKTYFYVKTNNIYIYSKMK